MSKVISLPKTNKSTKTNKPNKSKLCSCIDIGFVSSCGVHRNDMDAGAYGNCYGLGLLQMCYHEDVPRCQPNYSRFVHTLKTMNKQYSFDPSYNQKAAVANYNYCEVRKRRAQEWANQRAQANQSQPSN